MPSATPVRASPDKAEAILAAALDLFVDRGFHGTAVPAVANRAGVGAGTIYRYFVNKEALVNAVYQKWKTAVARFVFEGHVPTAPARDQFHEFVSRIAEFALTHPKAFAFLELHNHQSYLDADSRAAEQRVIDIATGLITNLQEKRLVKPIDPALVMGIVYWALVGVIRNAWEGKLTLDDACLAHTEQCLWEAIRY